MVMIARLFRANKWSNVHACYQPWRPVLATRLGHGVRAVVRGDLVTWHVGRAQALDLDIGPQHHLKSPDLAVDKNYEPSSMVQL